MNRANYIIFHPDHARQVTTVHALALVGNKLLTNWTGDVYVDKIGVGNEDPYVFHDPWLYSYCHASQLRRNFRKDCYLQVDSKLIFASGQQANKGILTVDTVFLIGSIQTWDNNPLQMPLKYQSHYQNNQSQLWRRHFRFPFHGCHETVSHTYEAELWQKSKADFSFLPLDISGQRASVSFDELPQEVRNKITRNVKGKFPVLLDTDEIEIVASKICSVTETKVLKIITNPQSVVSGQGKCGTKRNKHDDERLPTTVGLAQAGGD